MPCDTVQTDLQTRGEIYVAQLRKTALQPNATGAQIENLLETLNSHAVAHSFCEVFLSNNHSPKIFWRVIDREWSRADCATYNKAALCTLFRRYHESVSLFYNLNPKNKNFFNSLPDPVMIYRGHNADMIEGLSMDD